jgi:hypothetical protein
VERKCPAITAAGEGCRGYVHPGTRPTARPTTQTVLKLVGRPPRRPGGFEPIRSLERLRHSLGSSQTTFSPDARTGLMRRWSRRFWECGQGGRG